MALRTEQYDEIKRELDECNRPLFFFDDDQDGICAFLQLYQYKKEGKGIIVKTSPRLDKSFARKVEEYQPDKVFVLDIAELEDDFIDNVNVPVIWIDHHGPFQKQKVKYFNPKVENKEDNLPTSYLTYMAVKQSLWIATLGAVSDWFIPDYLDEFMREYPGLVEQKSDNPGDLIYGSKLGFLSRIFSFALKGKAEDVHKAIKTLTRIESPFEILDQATSKGKYIHRRYDDINKNYEPLITEVRERAAEDTEGFIVYTYKDDKMSFTSDLSNEMTYAYPNKMVLICREKDGEMKCSLRSAAHDLPPMLQEALTGLQGRGGGHAHACGLGVDSTQFDEFVERLKKASKKQLLEFSGKA